MVTIQTVINHAIASQNLFSNIFKGQVTVNLWEEAVHLPRGAFLPPPFLNES